MAETVSSPSCLLACDGLPLVHLMKFNQVAISSLGWCSHDHHVWCRSTLCWQTFIWTRANTIVTLHVNLDLVLDTPLQIKVPPILLKMFQSWGFAGCSCFRNNSSTQWSTFVACVLSNTCRLLKEYCHKGCWKLLNGAYSLLLQILPLPPLPAHPLHTDFRRLNYDCTFMWVLP